MSTTLTDLRATADTYMQVRARLIPGEHLALIIAGPSAMGTTAIVDIDTDGGGQRTVLRLQGTRHDVWLQLAAAISTMSDVLHAQRVR